MVSASFWKKAGKKQDRRAEKIRRAHTQRNKREHIQAPLTHRTPSALEKRPPRPKNDRCGKKELDPSSRFAACPFGVPPCRHHVRHRQNKNRNRQDEPQKKPASDGLKLSIFFILSLNRSRIQLKRHAAVGAITREITLHSGTHGAEIFCRRWLGRGNGNPPSTTTCRIVWGRAHGNAKKGLIKISAPRRISLAVLGGRSTWENPSRLALPCRVRCTM